MEDRATIIHEGNMRGLTSLYGELSPNDLGRIVNKHIAVAVEEIKEDEKRGY